MEGLLVLVILMIITNFSILRTKKKVIKENMSPIDFSKDKEYYRDILKEYTPEELSYIDDYKIKYPKEIIAILLNLKLKKRLEINDDKIIILDSSQEGLKRTEIFILQNIKDGKVIIKDPTDIELLVKEQVLEDGLVKENGEAQQKVKKKITKIKRGVALLFISFVIFYSNIENLNRYYCSTNNVFFWLCFYLCFYSNSYHYNCL